ncbi:MAG: hypothetical protein C0508_23625 [Cyanobacteria bacterium PR.023]|nr:hypothetical protein [Cyanobacteria bacterium PR.023]
MFRFCSIFASLLVLFLSTLRVDAAQLPEQGHPAAGNPPRLMLWSWQKIEDLSAIDTRKVGVALLVGRFTVDKNKISLEPRLSQLQLPPGCYREAVARVEMKQMPDESKMEEVSAKLAHSIVNLVLAHSHYDGLQIDFDAKELERPFYVHLLKLLRAQLPPGLTLSMTALASWSQGDPWLRQAIANDHLPVDYVVPMFFTMGVGKEQALRLLQENLPKPFNGHSSIGFSIGEAAAISQISSKLNSLDRIYLFCSPGWQHDRIKYAGKLVDQNLLKEKNNGI